MNLSSIFLKTILIIIITCTIILGEKSRVSAQCPMCKANVESAQKNKDVNKKVVGSGLNTGILYLLSAPYILIGGLAFYWYRNNQNKKLKQANISKSNSDFTPFNFNIKK